MPVPSKPLRKLGFLTVGLFDEADPRRGHDYVHILTDIAITPGPALAGRASPAAGPR